MVARKLKQKKYIRLISAIAVAGTIWAVSKAVVIAFSKEEKTTMIRNPYYAGQFYSGSRTELEKFLENLFSTVPKAKIEGKIIGIIVPHAGYIYSGECAAHAYKAIAGLNIETVILLGPTHRVAFEGAAVYPEGVWITPLGEVSIDKIIANALVNSYEKIKPNAEAHKYEHSLEVQVPFLQKALTDTDFKIVPIMFFEPTYEECEAFARVIANAARDKKVLLLASSDLYHGYSYDACVKTDAVTLSYIEKLDPKGLYQALKENRAQACGGYPIVILLLASKYLGANKSLILNRTNSNDVIGVKEGYCVGYASAVIYQTTKETQSQSQSKPAQKTQSQKSESDHLILSKEEQTELLKIARITLENYLIRERIPEFKPASEKLKEKWGVFVSLYKYGQLRGCIGQFEADVPLYQLVQKMAIAAATQDYRFPPVTAAELRDITIEISVLSKLRKISNINEIEIGKHGIWIKKGNRHGTYLPQVAVAQGWNRIQFLEHCCVEKAGLSKDAWKEKDTEIYIYTTQVFNEKEAKLK